jgi:NAD+ diphosphatase
MGANRKFISRIIPPEGRSELAWWFAFQESKLLVYEEPSGVNLPCLVNFAELGLTTSREHYLGRLHHRPCYAVEVMEGSIPPMGMTFEGLRQVYGRLDEDLFWIAARAVQIIDWDRTHQFCGRCGSPLRTKTTERAKECPQCGLLHFPRLAPAIIVLVERGHEMLLARSRHFMPGMYSASLDLLNPVSRCRRVVREVKEEWPLRLRT